MTEPILTVEDLHVAYRTGNLWTDVVRGMSFTVAPGETVGIVGESGCGKSTVAFATMNYLGRNGRISKGKISFEGRDLSTLSRAETADLRGNRVAMVYQNPLSSLNPAMKIGRQVAEVVRHHEGASRSEARRRVRAILDRVHMPDPESVMDRYPHQLSGGMQQRVVIAMALITNPDLVVMDEPTTGLDVTTEAAVLDLVNELKDEYGAAILYISHNLGVIAEVCDRVNVMYAGQVVEAGPVDQIFEAPEHPYARDLLECVPRLDWHYRERPLSSIEGRVPLPTQLPAGCVYAPRCRWAEDRCHHQAPELASFSPGPGSGQDRMVRCLLTGELTDRPLETAVGTPAGVPVEVGAARVLLSIDDVSKRYPTPRGEVHAVTGVELEVRAGETFSLVGESGCGKSTLGRVVVGLLAPTEGRLTFDGHDVGVEAGDRSEEVRQALQIVFQNPTATLNPSHRVGQILERAFAFYGEDDRDERRRRVAALLERVKLDASYANRYPRQLSGGERQRVAIARAFAGDPELIVCDEAVSALDVSVQAAILNLLVELKADDSSAYLFVSHDLGVVRYISDRVAVMYLGRLMEVGTSEQLFSGPVHPYTEALLSAVPSVDDLVEEPVRLEGSVPSPLDPPPGCPFAGRCPRKVGSICDEQMPKWQDLGDGHRIFCHIPVDELPTAQGVLGIEAGPAS